MVEVKRVGSSQTLIAGQSLTRVAGGAITKIDTYREGSYDSASGQFTGTPAVTQAFEYDGNARLTREMSGPSVQAAASVEFQAGFCRPFLFAGVGSMCWQRRSARQTA